MRAARALLAVCVVLPTATAVPAAAQVNNGPGIGPSTELERPDLARAMRPQTARQPRPRRTPAAGPERRDADAPPKHGS